MKLSVVIVNYNVKHFLEQCLNSVYAAAKHCTAEVFVVDNNSVDGSCAMVKEKFPDVILIENTVNYGFSYANNQAIKQSNGEYVLLLNPDTVVEEKTFSLICDFMDNQPEAGGLGVKMIDGKGNFLPESKRGLPTPSIAFYKISGLARLFPGSKRFGQYHLSYLNKDEIHQVDVLSGAFMLLRKTTIEKTGLLDEDFFMYGEDIDLSYRIVLAGYKNYYFPKTTIIHYKGESTKKGSVNYVIVFYKAMIIFAKKHFSGKNARLLSKLINFAIYLRASLAILYRFVRTVALPFFDTLIITAGFLIITPFWSEYKFGEIDAYPRDIVIYSLIAYIFIWLASLFFYGSYDKPVKIKNIYKGIISGILIILLLYSLVPEDFRTSRALILLGSAWTLLFVPLIRYLFSLTGRKTFKLNLQSKKKVVIVGNKEEALGITDLLSQNTAKLTIDAYVFPGEETHDSFYSGKLSQLDEIIKIFKTDEIIFCAKNLQAQQIIQSMLRLNRYNLDYKITSQDGVALIGSNDINAFGDLYDININSIAKISNRRNKRLIDVCISFLLLFILPLAAFFTNKPSTYFKNIIWILAGSKTFVSYSTINNTDNSLLPKIKNGILSPSDLLKEHHKHDRMIERVNFMYAKDYSVLNDLNIILKCWRKLGN